MNKEHIDQLIDRFLAGDSTPHEKALIERFYMEELRKRTLPETREEFSDAKRVMWHEIEKNTVPASGASLKKSNFSMLKVAAAAAVLFIAAAVVLYSYSGKRPAQAEQTVQTHYYNIKPGKNMAVLTLGTGQKIALNDVKEGIIATQPGILIKKEKNGELVFHSNGLSAGTLGAQLNTIEIPKGGQYKVIMPDGTRIWLNAASVMRFPSVFTGKERRVELTGEGYFEVAKNRSIPFKVKSNGQLVEVLGTHFNINSYADEGKIKTTLLEGSVKVTAYAAGGIVSDDVILRPGQQSVFAKKLTIADVDTEEAVAWKNNRFSFNSQPLEQIMRQISRWYDVEIDYKGNISGKVFTGAISRYSNVTQVLNMLELTNLVHFKIEERRITVMP